MYQIARICIPKLASPIVTTCDKFIAVFIEAAIGEG
jgi:hypothetical protein